MDRHDKRWDGEHYDRHIGYVSRLGQHLLQLLDPKPGEKVIDLGCGTGDLTYRISASGAEVWGVDASGEMLERARQKYPQLVFVQGDAQQLEWAEPVDAVFSNAALHWMKQAERVIDSVWHALRPGGRFVAELGGKGNVETIVRSLEAAFSRRGIDVSNRNPWFFPSVGEYSTLLEKRGFEVTFMELVDRPTLLEGGESGLAHWLDAFAGSYFTDVPLAEKEQIYCDVYQQTAPKLLRGSDWYADYRRLRFQAVKPLES